MLKSKSAKRKILRLTLFFFLSIWILGIISPYLNLSFLIPFYPYQKLMYSTVCHQNFLKSFTFGNVIFLVCARCTGIYFGAWLSSLIALFLSDNLVFKTKFLVFISIPIILDVMLLTFKFYTYNKLLSSFTGLLFGSVVFIYILSGIENLQFTEKHLMNNE